MLDLKKFLNFKLLESIPDTIINGEGYRISAALVNEDEQVFPLSKDKVVGFNLIDSIFNIGYEGTVIIENDGNIIEKASDNKTGKSFYRFKNNGRDFFILQIRPILSANEFDIPDKIKKFFYIDERFVIHSITEVNGDKRHLKLDFHAPEVQMMIETESLFSTGQSAKMTSLDSERKMHTGNALKTALKQVFDDSLFSSKWETGRDSIFYSSGFDESVMTTAKNLLRQHSDKDGNPCIMKKNNLTGKFELLSVKELFDTAISGQAVGERLVEGILLSMNIDHGQNPSLPYTNREPKGLLRNPNNIVTDYTYQYKDYSSSASYFPTRCVQSYNRPTGTFTTNIFSLERMNTVLEERYVDKFKALGNAKSSIKIHNDLKKGQQFQGIEVTNYDAKRSFGETDALYDMIFLNTGLEFTMKGMPHLKSGYFINVSPEIPSTENDFSKNIGGIYLIVKSEQILNGTTIENHVSCVKTYDAV